MKKRKIQTTIWNYLDHFQSNEGWKNLLEVTLESNDSLLIATVVDDISNANLICYKGYKGEIKYYDEGNIILGAVKGIRSVTTYQGRTPDEVEKNFRQSIEEFLSKCREDGVAPNETY